MRADLPSPTEDALKAALDCLPIGVGVFDSQRRLIYANRPFGELRGLTAARCRPGTVLSAILHHIGLTDGLEAGDMNGEVARGLAGLPGTGFQEVEQTTSTGLRLLIRFTPVSGGGLMLTCTDVTEARRIERAQRENEERYARVTEAVAEGIYDWNIERDELYVSPRLIEIFGFHGIALTASDWNARVHPDDRAAYSAALRECFRQRTRVLGCEYRVRLGNGEYRWVEDHGLPVRNEGQRAVRLVGAVSDITDRKLMEQALRESEQRHALAMEAINEGVYEWDLRSGEMYYSPRVRTVLGLSPEQLRTREDWIERIHPDDLPPYRAAVASHLKGESERLECEYRYRHPDGTWHWARQHGLALRDASGRATRMTGSTGDITGEKEFEIENKRLFDEVQARTEELSEALEQQTATSEVLKIISRSTFDLQKVLDTLVESAAVLCGADIGALRRREGDAYEVAATFGFAPEARARIEGYSPLPSRSSIFGQAVLENRTVHIPDILADPDYARPDVQRLTGFRSALGVLLRREGNVIGALVLQRFAPGPFTPQQIELVETFANQAVIAIENTRLFEEVQSRNRDLIEALEYRTATSDVLDVISRSPTDVQPVFNAILRSAVRLCDGVYGTAIRFDGELMHLAAGFNHTPEMLQALQQALPMPPDHQLMSGRAILTRSVVQVEDALADADYSQKVALAGGFRSMLAVPLLRGENPVGCIVVNRGHPGSFSKSQIELLKTFADQAVIAIENARLFEEVQARTRDLSESLQQQTATADVLKVISRSAFDLQRVFETVAESAVRLCEADKAFIFRYDGELLRAAVAFNASDELRDFVERNPIRPGRHSGTARCGLERRTIRIDDVMADPEYTYGAKGVDPIRTVLCVPMLKDDDLLGVILVYHLEVRPFTDKQVALIETFADQAVIAIENVRLLSELRESLRQQTATADVLKVISRSTFDLQTVLRTLLESAVQLCEADQGTITRQRDGKFYRAENHGFSAEFRAAVSEMPVEPDRGSAIGRALLEGRVIHIPDVLADPDYTFTQALKLGDFRAILGVPMMKEGVAIGVLAFTRREPRPFTGKQIELVSTFADQAAIAIENVRLFESVEARTRELARSLEELRFAQDRLVQTEKLASLGQLTAGIAHEIKNPLNFVNNFSAVSVELIDELRAALEGARLDDKTRAEIVELTEMLQGNLERVVQHGKRADSIVKNMLLHSRQNSGEHRPVDINAIVEESLNLAYHGARAERQGFNITLERSFDPAAGEVDLFSQEITRVLLNLISNGFYAATKRGADAKGTSYQPTLTAATRSLGESVEIRIRDNGTGIPPEVKDRMFNPFFTTKPAGEGTGLGLSLSHDIVVKQHAGTIEVDTQLGEFTEFRIVLPRGAATIAKSGEKA